MMEANEIRLRLIEAAAKAPTIHPSGFAAGVQATAASWYEWVVGPAEKPPAAGQDGREMLGLPRKKT